MAHLRLASAAVHHATRTVHGAQPQKKLCFQPDPGPHLYGSVAICQLAVQGGYLAHMQPVCTAGCQHLSIWAPLHALRFAANLSGGHRPADRQQAVQVCLLASSKCLHEDCCQQRPTLRKAQPPSLNAEAPVRCLVQSVACSTKTTSLF